jgi:hypothetical protein
MRMPIAAISTRMPSRIPAIYADASETAGIDHHERKNHKHLADKDPVKQAHHFTLRPPEIWRFRVNIPQKHAVKQPSLNEHENVGSDKCDDESLHKFKV